MVNMNNPLVSIEMENGAAITVELYPHIAPNTVNNFISLIKAGFYDGLIFHRVIPSFIIQGGCPLGTGTGGPGYRIRGEFSNNDFPNPLAHDRGVISMARSSHPDSAGSQFFIMVQKAPHLDGSYAAFGRVLDNMEAVDRIASTDRDYRDRPYQEQKMKKVTVNTFGFEYPEVVKI
jgi:peptidyl-prolyl cis-trans isomerase B (cyclophilin B)